MPALAPRSPPYAKGGRTKDFAVDVERYRHSGVAVLRFFLTGPASAHARRRHWSGAAWTTQRERPAKPGWNALATVHVQANADVRLVSPQNAWNGIAVSRFRLGQVDVRLPPLTVPAFGVNFGESLRLKRALYGRRMTGSVTSGRLAVQPQPALVAQVAELGGLATFKDHGRAIFRRRFVDQPRRGDHAGDSGVANAAGRCLAGSTGSGRRGRPSDSPGHPGNVDSSECYGYRGQKADWSMLWGSLRTANSMRRLWTYALRSG